MCGIVGYIGQKPSKEVLLKGLERLEYRGYDSAGIALLTEDGLYVAKEKGRIKALREAVNAGPDGCIGIGHTRWATHGKPSRRNAHPHRSCTGRFTLVHNGVIENYQEIRDKYLSSDLVVSDTDTEIIVQVVDKFVSEGSSVEEAFRNTLAELKGSYAVAMIDAEDRQHIYAGKNKSPLLVGLGSDENVVCSDAMAVLQLTDRFLELNDGEIVVLEQDSVAIKDLEGGQIERAPFTAQLDLSDIEKGTYSHFMLKEIDEQPYVIRNLITRYQSEDGGFAIPEEIRSAVSTADRIYIVACGTSYHAGLVSKNIFEKITRKPVEVHISSEFLYNPPLITPSPLFVFISQSGETADSRGVLVQIKKQGYKTLTVTNVPGSTLSREADFTLLTHAGPEIAVASTKAYTAQIATLAILAIDTAIQAGTTPDVDLFHELAIAANAMEEMCRDKAAAEAIVKEFLAGSRNAFMIGRTIDYYVCLEGALKLKEISYIQCEGFAGGELKHGPIALIEEGTPLFALITQESINHNTRGNVKEVVARGGKPCILAMGDLYEEGDRWRLPKVHDILTPLVSVIPLQLIAYYAALQLGCDVDKPRNLAKSVTVE